MPEQRVFALSLSAVPVNGGSAPYYYRLYGLLVASDIHLPLPLLEHVDRPVVDLHMERSSALPPQPAGESVAETRCYCTAHAGRVIRRLYRGGDGTVLVHAGLGTFAVTADASWVTIYPESDADYAAVGLALTGEVAVLVLQQRLQPCLHTSAVQVSGKTLCFLGSNGDGKSTMAAAFLRHGGSLLTDDILPLRNGIDGILGVPGVPYMKLWQESAEQALAFAGDLPSLTASLDKKLFHLEGRFPLVEQPVRLDALFFVQRYEPTDGANTVTVQRVRPREALQLLVTQTACREFLARQQSVQVLAYYARLSGQAPMYRVTYPNGFSHQNATVARILALVGGGAEV